jgi:DNA replication protein DnaC
MKNILFSFIIAWSLLFSKATLALETAAWIGAKDYTDTESVWLDTFFEHGYSMAIHRLITRGDKWLVKEVTGGRYSKTIENVKLKQAPHVAKRIVTNGTFFLYKKIDHTARIVVSLMDQYNSTSVYYNNKEEASFKLMEEFKADLDKEMFEESAYRGRVLELKRSGLIGFYNDVDEANFQWKNFIYAPEKKKSIIDTVDNFIKFYEKDKWKKLGLPLNRGILLYGPPGTGKSFVAKIILSNVLNNRYNNSKVTYLHVLARHTQQVSTIRQIYQVARRMAPSVIFFEDVDLIAGTDRGDRSDIKNEFMQQLSGLEKLEGVMTIATTNYADRLDPALRRSKRLSYHFKVGLPKIEERKKLFQLYCSKALNVGLDFVHLADRTEGMTGADIKGLVSLALEKAIRDKSIDRTNLKTILKQEQLVWALKMKNELSLKKEGGK